MVLNDRQSVLVFFKFNYFDLFQVQRDCFRDSRPKRFEFELQLEFKRRRGMAAQIEEMKINQLVSIKMAILLRTIL